MYLYLEMIKRSVECDGLAKEGSIPNFRVPTHWEKKDQHVLQAKRGSLTKMR